MVELLHLLADQRHISSGIVGVAGHIRQVHQSKYRREWSTKVMRHFIHEVVELGIPDLHTGRRGLLPVVSPCFHGASVSGQMFLAVWILLVFVEATVTGTISNPDFTLVATFWFLCLASYESK